MTVIADTSPNIRHDGSVLDLSCQVSGQSTRHLEHWTVSLSSLHKPTQTSIGLGL